MKYKKLKINGICIDEHRHIMQQHLGRKLDFNECVHHINGNNEDNRLENLELITRSDHTKIEYSKGKLHKFTKEDIKKGHLLKNGYLREILPGNKVMCTVCKEVKHMSCFHKHKRQTFGIDNRCKECRKK